MKTDKSLDRNIFTAYRAKMLHYSLMTVLCLAIFSCEFRQKASSAIDVNRPPFSASELSQRLEEAYALDNNGDFDQLFEHWNRSIKASSDSIIGINDTTQAIYQIYKTFYHPLALKKIGDWEWGNRLNKRASYIAVQHKLYYSVYEADSLQNFEGSHFTRDSIENFRPPVGLKENRVLYLTEPYQEVLNEFLGTESRRPGEGNVMNPSRPAGESEKRHKALREYLPILRGHWGGYWHINTHPDVFSIAFNKSFDQAKVYFRVGYQGGEAFLIKKKDEWILEESYATWIE